MKRICVFTVIESTAEKVAETYLKVSSKPSGVTDENYHIIVATIAGLASRALAILQI
jgi:hypothetical protein